MEIPSADSENPFAGYGTEVSDARFIGRSYELAQLSSRLCGPADFSSVAIVGLPRVGKTSLARKLVRIAAGSAPFPLALAACDLGSYLTSDDFFHSLASQLIVDCRSRGLSTQQIEYFARNVVAPPHFRFDETRPLFEAMRTAGIRPLCVIDEFDAGRNLFKSNPQVFHQLRELTSNAKYKLGAILISKRRLSDVSRLAGVEGGYWSNTLSELPVRVFAAEERDSMWARLQVGGEDIDRELRELVDYWCGGQPYLLEAFAFHFFSERLAARPTDRMWFERSVWPIIADYYEQVYEVLQSSGLHGKVAQALLGPNEDLTPADLIGLTHYGVLTETETGIKPFVEGFAWYLRQKVHIAGLWSMWTAVEAQLREQIDRRLTQHFGTHEWHPLFCAKHPQLSAALKEAEARSHKDRFTEPEVCGLLAFTYPKDLFQILMAEWNAVGQPILGGSRRHWEDRLELLARVRTPMAHSRERSLRAGDREYARSILGEMHERLTG